MWRWGSGPPAIKRKAAVVVTATAGGTTGVEMGWGKLTWTSFEYGESSFFATLLV